MRALYLNGIPADLFPTGGSSMDNYRGPLKGAVLPKAAVHSIRHPSTLRVLENMGIVDSETKAVESATKELLMEYAVQGKLIAIVPNKPIQRGKEAELGPEDLDYIIVKLILPG